EQEQEQELEQEQKDSDQNEDDATNDGSDSDFTHGRTGRGRIHPNRGQNHSHGFSRNEQPMTSIRSERPGGGAGVSNSAGNKSKSQAKRLQPPPGADRTLTSKSKNRRGDDDGDEKDIEKASPAMDYTQKTPIWKGLVDSFNPVDTLRELWYGIRYLYRWSRGIPVDKDSRRLLDLERVFGRQRPEVPYIPSKDEEKKKKKKKKKKRDEETDESDVDSEKDVQEEEEEEDEEDDDRLGKNRKNEKDRGKDREKGDDDDGQDTIRAKGKQERDRSHASGRDRIDVSRYRQFDDQNFGSLRFGIRGSSSQRRADAIYDITFGPSGDGVGGPSSGKSTIPRKPVKLVGTFKASEAKTGQQLPLKKGNTRYLGKEEAARTDRATLPDIQPELVERKAALSGLYVDRPLTLVEIVDSPSTVDIPMPRSYHQHNPSYELRDRDWRQG
ncbi:hypothetical protein BGZ65_011643, partial [Modicella reniformis]